MSHVVRHYGCWSRPWGSLAPPSVASSPRPRSGCCMSRPSTKSRRRPSRRSRPPISASPRTTARAKSCGSPRRPRRCPSPSSWTTRRPPRRRLPTCGPRSPASCPTSRASGPVALITTADRPTIAQDYTTDAEKLTQAANRLFSQPGSGATLLDAVVEVSRGLGSREEERAAIVLVTLELTEFSTLHYSQVLDGLKKSRRDDERRHPRQPARLEPERCRPQPRGRPRSRHPGQRRYPCGRAHQPQLRHRLVAGLRRAEAPAPRRLRPAATADPARTHRRQRGEALASSSPERRPADRRSGDATPAP